MPHIKQKYGIKFLMFLLRAKNTKRALMKFVKQSVI